tara:strand:- start:63 stop:650 length:588 start_codon:yes stop_codon:yes gene_type:complete
MKLFKNDEFKELKKTIEKMLSEADKEDDILEFMDALWPAVMRCETFFRNSNDIRALEFEGELLMKMQNSLYLETYWTYAYTICKRILKIDPNHKKAKKAIENIISIWDCRVTRDPDKLKEMEEEKKKTGTFTFTKMTRTEIESMLEEEFKKNKEGNYDCFLDDWEARYKIEDSEDSKVDPNRGDLYSTSSKGRKY